MAEFSAVQRIPHQSGGCYFPSLLWNPINKGVINLVTPYTLLNCERQVQRSRFATFRIKGLQICGHPVIAHFCARRTFLAIVTCGNGSVPDSTGQGVYNIPHAANETPSVLTPYQLSSKRGQLRVGLRKNVKLFATICAASWKSDVCHERNADRLDFQLITNCYRLGTLQNTTSLSHVSGWSWNATPF